MKCVFVLSLLALVVTALADTKVHSRGCRYIMGRCVEECPEGTRAYTSACGKKRPEATCEQPSPVEEGGPLCDYSACYCDAGTVRDKNTKKCVKLEDCSK